MGRLDKNGPECVGAPGIRRSDMAADGWHRALRDARARIRKLGASITPSVHSMAQHQARILADLERSAKVYARERLRAGGDA